MEKVTKDVDRRDLICDLGCDIEKAVLLGGDITCDYLGMCGDPRDLPEPEKTKFMQELFWQYHRYSLTMDLLMEQVFKIKEKVDRLWDM